MGALFRLGHLSSVIFLATAMKLYAGGELQVSSSIIPLTNVPISDVCERAEGAIRQLSISEMPGILVQLDMEIAAEHLGVQQFEGETYGVNAISPITTPVVAAAASQSLAPLTGEEKALLSGQLNGQSFIPPDQIPESYQFIKQAQKLVEENAGRSGLSNGDPNITLYEGRIKGKTPDQLVGQLIAGFDEFGLRITFYAGKIRKVFAAESYYNGYWIWAELETVDGEIITVPLSFSSRSAPFFVNGDPLVKGWHR